MTISGFNSIDGGPYPASSEGPIWTFSDNLTHIRGRHTFKAGVFVEYSGEDDFDQINVSILPGDTNNQNGRFEFNDGRTGGTGLAVANAAMGLFTNYGEIGAALQDGLARPGHRRLRPGQLEGARQPDRRRRVPLRLLAALARQAQQRGHVQSRVLRPARAAVTVDPRTGAILPARATASTASCSPATASRRRPAAQIEAAGNPEYTRLFRGVPDGLLGDAHHGLRAAARRRLPAQREDGAAPGRRHLPHARDAQRLDAARRQPARSSSRWA